MKGRKPRLLSLSEADKSELQKIAGSDKTEQRIARRARILLSLSSPQTMVNEVAKYVQMTPTAIWQICRRYRDHFKPGARYFSGAKVKQRVTRCYDFVILCTTSLDPGL